MKLLVLAQTPPPLHGQSQMVRTLVDGLPAHGLPLHHVNLRLSRDHADIGRWRLGKLLAVLAAAGRAVAARWRHGCDTLYCVPAPGKRGALYRDWLLLALCRPFFPRLVLHLHNGGLADWLATHATAPERWLTRALLGRADLAIVLTPSLRPDADALRPRRVAVVPNGIPDPCPAGAPPPPPAGAPFHVLFLGAVTAAKGADVLLAAAALLRERGLDVRVTFAGECPDAALRAQLAAAGPGVRLAGFVAGGEKLALLAACHCVCLPTRYPHEAQPLVLLEALACDRALVVSRWRGLPETVPPGTPLVAPGEAGPLADALARVQAAPPARGAQRDFFLRLGTDGQHLAALAAALRAGRDAPAPGADTAGAARDYRVTLLSQVVRLLCKAVSVIALARLVAPEQHGLYAMAGVVLGGLMLFRDFGFGPAMVQAPQLSPEQEATLCRLHLLIGFALCGLTAALAPAAAWFFQEPRLTALLGLLGSAFLLIGAGGFPRARLVRQLRFREISRLETAAAGLGTAALITAGWLGAGAYAFGVFVLTVEAFTAVAAWRLCRWRPSAPVRWAGLRTLFRPGSELTGYHLVTYGLAQLDTLVVGQWFGAATLGPYARAGQLLALPSLHVVVPLSQVTFATLARLGPGSPAFVPHLRQCINHIAHLTLPVAVVCAALPHETVRLVLGPNWDPAAPMLRWLAVNAALGYLAAAVYPLGVATGRTGRLAGLALLSAPVIAAGLWLGRPYGPAGMAAGLAAANALLLGPRLLWAVRDTPARLADFAAALAGPVGVSLAVAAGIAFARVALPAAPWLTRLLAGGAGGAAAALLLAVLWPRVRHELRALWAPAPAATEPGTP